jgi:hypothetical protein
MLAPAEQYAVPAGKILEAALIVQPNGLIVIDRRPGR